MSKRTPWTRNQKLLLATVIVGVVAASLHFFGKQGVQVDGDVGAIGDHANVTIYKRTGIDPNEYRSLAEEKGRADERIVKLKEEMREIDATKHDDLLKRYSLGYILFYIDHTNMVIPYESRIKAECTLDISEAKVSYIGKDGINIELPNIACEGGPIFYQNSWGVRRQVGYQTPIFGRFHGIQMYLEMLVDHGDSFICVLGFANG